MNIEERRLVEKRKNLKHKLICIVKTKSILKYYNFDADIPEELYIISIVNVLKTINKVFLNQFILDFQNIILHKKLPVFNIQQVISIYKIWLKNRSYINNLVYLTEKLNKNIITKYDNKSWDIVFKYSGSYKFNELYVLFNIIAKFQKIINTNKGINNNVLEELFKLQLGKNIPQNNKSIEKYVQNKYSYLFTIINCQKQLWSDYEFIYLISKRFQESNIIPDFSVSTTKLFNSFLRTILNQNINYIFKYTLHSLQEIFKIYEIKPELFDNLNIPQKELTLPLIPTILATDNSIDSWFSSGNIMDHLSQDKFVFPTVFSCKYLNLNKQQKILFFNILKGQSIRKQSLPFTLSRKAENIIINQKLVNNGTTIYEDIVIAEYLSKNVGYDFALIVSTLLTKNKDENDYYIRIFISLYKKGLMAENIQETYDYMKAKQFFETNNKSFKTKILENILQDVIQYHEENLTFHSTSFNKIPDVKFAHNVKTKSLRFNGSVFQFIPLQTAKQLYIEGYKMSHCVYSYKDKCIYDGEVIYSLREKEKNNSKILLTIEVDNNKRIVQIKGKYNRLAKPYEMEIIKLWAKKLGFSLMHN